MVHRGDIPRNDVPPAGVYRADPERYNGRMPYRRTGRSGLDLPAISLGLWHNFGDNRPLETQRAILRRAFDLGVTHFDLANNYGPPPGAAELNFGRILPDGTCGPAPTAAAAPANTSWPASTSPWPA
jgi:L-glyceraldehyde 3-phosphate reductase